MDAAKPQSQQQAGRKEVPWDIRFVDELKSGLHTCRILYEFSFSTTPARVLTLVTGIDSL